MPRTHHCPLPFPLTSQVSVSDQARGNGKRKLAAGHSQHQAGLRGREASGQRDTTGPTTPPTLLQLGCPLPGDCLGLSKPCLARCSTTAPAMLLISLTAWEQRWGLLSRYHVKDSSEELLLHLSCQVPTTKVFRHPFEQLYLGTLQMCLQWSNLFLAPVTSPLLSPLPVSQKQKSLDIHKYFKMTSSLEKKPSLPALYLQEKFPWRRNCCLGTLSPPVQTWGGGDALCKQCHLLQ